MAEKEVFVFRSDYDCASVLLDDLQKYFNRDGNPYLYTLFFEFLCDMEKRNHNKEMDGETLTTDEKNKEKDEIHANIKNSTSKDRKTLLKSCFK